MHDAVDGELAGRSGAGDGRNRVGILCGIVAGIGADAGIGAGYLGGVLHESEGDGAAGIHGNAIDVGQIQEVGLVGLKIDGREMVRLFIGRIDVLAGTVDEDAGREAGGNSDRGAPGFCCVVTLGKPPSPTE